MTGDDSPAESAPPGPGDPAAFRDLHDREPGLFAVAVLTLGVGLATRVLVRFLPAYLRALGAGPAAVGVVWSGWRLARLAAPYLDDPAVAVESRLAAGDRWPGDALADLRDRFDLREGYAAALEPTGEADGSDSRYVVAGFGLLTGLGYLLWVAAPQLGPVGSFPLTVGPWAWTLAGAACLATWYSHGPGAAFRIAERRLPTGAVARRLAAARTFRRVGVLAGLPVLALVFAGVGAVGPAFQLASAGAASLAAAAAVGRAVLDPDDGTDVPDRDGGREPPRLDRVLADLRGLSGDDRALALADGLVRVGRGLCCPFLVLAVADFGLGGAVLGITVGPAALFAGLLAAETLGALLAAAPVARLTDRVGVDPVVGGGCLVVSLFPLALAAAPSATAAAGLFAGFGVGVAARPFRRELLVCVGRNCGDSAAASLRLAGRAAGVASPLAGGALYAVSPTLAFGLATAVCLLGCREFLRYAR
ncbi:hypothetical protein [Halorussus sp. AFM4]|uniref:hypothetical protein n=1 Tax=Halorussus sp. AFM4 TaxID=3421651 RepID=UPI003EBDBD17